MTADDAPRPERNGIDGGFGQGPVTVASLADARAILTSPNACLVRTPAARGAPGANPLEAFLERGRRLADLWMWGSPPETHRRLRKAVAAAVGAPIVDNCREAVRGHATALLAAADAEQGIDLVAAYARPLIRDALLNLLGIPSSKRDPLGVHLQGMADFLKGGGQNIRPGQYFAVAATGQIVAESWAVVLPDEARTGRALVAAVEAGDLSLDEAVAQAVLLLLGNSYTTADALCGLMARLSEQPCIWKAARQGELTVEALIEEGLRLGPPTHMVLVRRATGTVTCPSGVIPSGREIVIPLAAVHRDPVAFPDPERFDPARTDGRHIAFGAGRHLCTGAHLARATLAVGLSTLLRALPEWPDDVEAVYGPSLLGGVSVTALHVRGGAIQC